MCWLAKPRLLKGDTGSSPVPSFLKYVGSSSVVERPAVNRVIGGSNPPCHLEDWLSGRKAPVLKTGVPKGHSGSNPLSSSNGAIV